MKTINEILAGLDTNRDRGSHFMSSPARVNIQETPILSVRPADDLKHFYPVLIDTMCTTSDRYIYRVYVGGEITGGEWEPCERAEVNESPGSFEGGKIIAGGFVSSQKRVGNTRTEKQDSANKIHSPITVTVQNIRGYADVLAGIIWEYE